MQPPKIVVCNAPIDVARNAAERIVESANRFIESRGRFRIVLAGGSTPRMLYELLADEPYRAQIPWEKVEIFFGDERCVPPTSTESNFRTANDALLLEVPIPGDNVYRMRGEDDPQSAAADYGKILKEKFGEMTETSGGADLVLLGMGEDGHTASLFPGTEALGESKHRCVANFVEKLKKWRLTMTAPFLNRSHEILVLVTGAAKAAVLRDVLEGPSDPSRLPIQLIQPVFGTMTWILDKAAAGMDD